MIKIYRTNKDNPDFLELVKYLDTYLNQQYEERQKQYAGFNKTDTLDAVVVAYKEEEPVGCGAFRKFDDNTVELKRMFVRCDYRNTGVGSLLLQELESWAIENGFTSLVLETGDNQPEAKGFYAEKGYSVIPDYPPYDNMPGSICMQKELI